MRRVWLIGDSISGGMYQANQANPNADIEIMLIGQAASSAMWGYYNFLPKMQLVDMAELPPPDLVCVEHGLIDAAAYATPTIATPLENAVCYLNSINVKCQQRGWPFMHATGPGVNESNAPEGQSGLYADINAALAQLRDLALPYFPSALYWHDFQDAPFWAGGCNNPGADALHPSPLGAAQQLAVYIEEWKTRLGI